MNIRAGCLGVLLLSVVAPLAFGAISFQLSDRSKVYLGSPDRIVSPAVVEIQRIFDLLPSYQEALKHKEGSAKRALGLKKASDEFKDLVARVCRDKKFELLAERGTLTAHDSGSKKPVELPDITQDLIKLIPAK